MTAEIVVMNSEAIALAADSAVTLQRGPQQKVSTTANKLYELSQKHPVGIMVYGNARFMNLPWETIVKTYRNKVLPQKGFDTLAEYGTNFLNYLSYENIQFPDGADVDYIRTFVQTLLFLIREEIESDIRKAIDEGQDLDESMIITIVETVINRRYELYRRRKPVLSYRISSAVLRKYRRGIDREMTEILSGLYIGTSLKQKIRRTLSHAFSRVFIQDMGSGLVIAGFGQKEFLPMVESYLVEGIIFHESGGVTNEILKQERDEEGSANGFEVRSAVIPYAQREMVERFMDGIDSSYRYVQDEFLSGLCNDFASKVVQDLSRYNDDEKLTIKRDLEAYGRRLIREFRSNMDEFTTDYFADPTIHAVGQLAKSELALMAESLVHLTSLKRKVSQDPETVAEPIDVAVITKGDGFVWIKRKHYFEANINPQYFIRRFKEQ